MNAINVVQTDVYRLRDVKTRVDQCVQDTIATTRIIDGFRNPQQNGQHLKTYAEFPLQYVMTSRTFLSLALTVLVLQILSAGD